MPNLFFYFPLVWFDNEVLKMFLYVVLDYKAKILEQRNKYSADSAKVNIKGDSFMHRNTQKF